MTPDCNHEFNGHGVGRCVKCGVMVCGSIVDEFGADSSALEAGLESMQDSYVKVKPSLTGSKGLLAPNFDSKPLAATFKVEPYGGRFCVRWTVDTAVTRRAGTLQYDDHSIALFLSREEAERAGKRFVGVVKTGWHVGRRKRTKAKADAYEVIRGNERLQYQYHNNEIVNKSLSPAVHGECSLQDALLSCVVALAERNAEFFNRLTKAAMLESSTSPTSYTLVPPMPPITGDVTGRDYRDVLRQRARECAAPAPLPPIVPQIHISPAVAPEIAERIKKEWAEHAGSPEVQERMAKNVRELVERHLGINEPECPFKVGDLVTRDGSDVQRVIDTNGVDMIHVVCIKAPDSSWCVVGDQEWNLASRYDKADAAAEFVVHSDACTCKSLLHGHEAGCPMAKGGD